MWRHLWEMCMFLFIMLDARPRAIYLRPRNAHVGYHQIASYVALYYARCQATRYIP